MDNKLFNFWAERSKCLFISAFMAIFYAVYIITHFYGGIINTVSGWETLGGSIAATLVTPHIACIATGAVFNLVAFLGKKVWGAVTALVLYSVGGCLFLLYIPFCIPMIVFSAIGAYFQKKLNEKLSQEKEDILNWNLKRESTKLICSFIIVGISGYVYMGAMTIDKTDSKTTTVHEEPSNSDIALQPSENDTNALSDDTRQKIENTQKERDAKESASNSKSNSDKKSNNGKKSIQSAEKVKKSPSKSKKETQKNSDAKVTLSQQNALKKAKTYLEFSGFSRSGLIKQLEFEKFPSKDATYAVDHCGANWNEQAIKKAKSYLEFSSFSAQGLIDQLKFEGFTQEQAEYSVKSIGL